MVDGPAGGMQAAREDSAQGAASVKCGERRGELADDGNGAGGERTQGNHD